MKIVLDKEEGTEQKIKESQKEEMPRYIVKKSGNNGGKPFGYLLMGIIGGIVGGFTTYYITMNNTVPTSDKSTVTNETITSYNFTTVENPVVAISKQVGPSVVGVRVTYTAQTFFRFDPSKWRGFRYYIF